MIDEFKLRRVMGAILGVRPQMIDDSSSMETMETWDSLKQINLIVALEEEFSIRISDDEISDATSFVALKQMLERQTDSGNTA